MATPQKFADAVQVSTLGNPLDANSGLEGIAEAVSSFGREVSADRRAKAKAEEAAAKAAADAAGSNIVIDNLQRENVKTFTDIQTQNPKTDLSNLVGVKDLEERLRRLDQVDGISFTTKSQLRRNFLVQQAIAQNPGRAKEIMNLAGLDPSQSSFEEQGAETKREREELLAQAAEIKAIRNSYGDLTTLTPEQEIEQSVGSVYMEMEGDLLRWNKIAESTTASASARSGANQLTLARQMPAHMEQLQGVLREALANPNADRTARQAVIFGGLSSLRAQLTADYPLHPELVDTHMAALETAANRYTPLINGGQETTDLKVDDLQFRADHMRAIDLASAQLGLKYDKERDAMRPVRTQRQIAESQSAILDAAVKFTDRMNALGGEYDAVLKLGGQNMSSILAHATNGTAETVRRAIEIVDDPTKGSEFERSKAVKQTLELLMANPEAPVTPENSITLVQGIEDFIETYPENSAGRAGIENKITELSRNPEFLKQVEQNPALARLAEPVAKDVSREITTTLQDMSKTMANDKVLLLGATPDRRSRRGLIWENLGQYVGTDTEALAEGRFRLRVKEGADLSAAELSAMNSNLQKYNLRYSNQMTQNITDLAKLQGHGDFGRTMAALTGGTQGFSIANLSPSAAVIPEDDRLNVQGFLDDLLSRALDTEGDPEAIVGRLREYANNNGVTR